MQLRVNRVSRALAGKPVLREVTLTLEDGQVACLLGSSGCGKTTLLRCIAGFEGIDAGTITMGDERVAGPDVSVAPHAREVGMVFQDHALFPHLSVADNAAFGLHERNRRNTQKRVDEVLRLVGLEGYAGRFPHQLSGGQQQRAALARALAPDPRLLLLDEPFASLDRELRYRLVQEVGAILRSSATTALWVTHDAREALQAADYVGVMRDGRIAQWDTPAQLYGHPATPEVATALGDCTLLSGRLVAPNSAETVLGPIPVDAEGDIGLDQPVSVLIRPEQVTLSKAAHATATEPQLAGAIATLRHVWFHGLSTLCVVELSDGTELSVSVQASPSWQPGLEVMVRFSADRTVAFPLA